MSHAGHNGQGKGGEPCAYPSITARGTYATHVASVNPAPIWEFISKRERHAVSLTPALSCNTIDVTLDVACAAWGITRLLSYQVGEALKFGKLVEVLSEFENRRLPIHLMHSEGHLTGAKIRTFIDFAATALCKEAKHIEAV